MERREEDNRRRSETEGPNKFCGRGLKALPSDEYGAGHLNDEHGQGGATQDQEGETWDMEGPTVLEGLTGWWGMMCSV